MALSNTPGPRRPPGLRRMRPGGARPSPD
jgi:hypothetical protein